MFIHDTCKMCAVLIYIHIEILSVESIADGSFESKGEGDFVFKIKQSIALSRPIRIDDKYGNGIDDNKIFCELMWHTIGVSMNIVRKKGTI